MTSLHGRSFMLSLLLAASLPGAPVKADPLPLPGKAAPPYILAARVEKENLVVQMPQYTVTEQKKIVEAKEGDKVVKKEVTVRTFQVNVRPMTYPLKDVQAFGI